MHIIIVGFGAGGFAAANAIQKAHKNIEVSIVDPKNFDLMHTCGIPYVVEGKIADLNNLKHNLDLPFEWYKGYTLHTVDSTRKFIKISGSSGLRTLKYDSLILATGAHPVIPNIDGICEALGKSAFTVSSLEDGKALLRLRAKKVTVLGAGAIGLETAIALKKRGNKVKVVEIASGPFPKIIDEDMAELIIEYFKEQKIEMITKCACKSVDCKRGKISAVNVEKVSDQQKSKKIDNPKKMGKAKKAVKTTPIKSDCVIIATGTRPNISYLKDNKKIKVGKFGIEIDDKARTSVKDVYAIGDIAQIRSKIGKFEMPSGLASNAYRLGLVAGLNALKDKKLEKSAEDFINTFTSKLGDLEVSATGLSSALAQLAKIDFVEAKLTIPVLPGWYGPSEKLTLKILVNKKNRKVIGAQCIGLTGASWRINVLSTAMKADMTIDQVADLELAYSPPLSDSRDIIHFCAEAIMRRMK